VGLRMQIKKVIAGEIKVGGLDGLPHVNDCVVRSLRSTPTSNSGAATDHRTAPHSKKASITLIWQVDKKKQQKPRGARLLTHDPIPYTFSVRHPPTPSIHVQDLASFSHF